MKRKATKNKFMENNLHYLIWLHILNQELTPVQWNDFVAKVNEAGLQEEIFGTSVAKYDQFFKDFLNGKYKIVRKED